ncbi:MAG: PAS domain S-box protein [Verrucomicrobiota bacterium]
MKTQHPPGDPADALNPPSVRVDTVTRISKKNYPRRIKSSLLEQADTRTVQANLRTDQANQRTDEANLRTEKADTRTAEANTRTAQADLRTKAAATLSAALRASELSYRRLFESARDGILILEETTGRITDVNPFLIELLGFSHGEMVGKTVGELSPFKDVVSNQAMLEQLQKDGYIRYENLPLETRDGRHIDVEFISNAYQSDGIKVIQCNIRDVTARKTADALLRESEEKYRNLFDCSRDALLMMDPVSKRFTSANPAAVRIFGAKNEAELTARGPEALSPARQPDGSLSAERARQIDEIVLRDGTRFFEWTHQRIGGEVFAADVLLTRIELNGKPTFLTTVRDITAHKQAEEKLRASEARLSDIMFTIADWVWEVDENGTYTYSSQKGLDWFGCVLGKTPFDFMPPDEVRRVTASFFEFAASQSPIKDLENWSIRKDGERICLLTNGVPILDQAGKLRGYRGLDKDITERKLAENKLIRSERLLRETQEMSKTGYYINNLGTGLWESSPSLDRLFGIGPDFVRDMEGWGRLIHPDDRERTINYFLRVVADKKSFRMDYRILRPDDGELRWMAGYGDIEFDETGNPVRMVGCIQDITDRKQSEELNLRLSTAVEQAAEAIVITDTQGTILYANPAFEKSTGYTRAEVAGQNPRLLKSGRHDGAFYLRMWETILRGEVWHGHFINQRKDGTIYEEEATISAIRDAAGKIINFVAVKRDVTHEVELEGQLRQSQKMEAVGTLAGGIAHDFNNILNIIFGYSNLLQLDLAGNRESLEKVGEILKAGERAKDLVQQILTFSRQREQERHVIQLNMVIKETTKLLRASLPANIVVVTELAADAPMVLADATQIYQVIMNLGANALHAMEHQASGRLKITLDAFKADKAFLQKHPELRAIKYARLTVADTGCGMDARTLERIFDPFYTTKPVGKGTGLGLAVVHGIVKAHDGVITLESKPGQGTTFCLYFPEQISDLFKDGIPEDLIPCGQGQKILMVDDEVALVGIYQKLLKTLKYEGTIVTSPREAVLLVRENPGQFDLVITDLTMPEMNGLVLARQIREIRADMPVILATGFHGTVSDRQLADAGVCEVVEKPISMAKLAMVLRGILGK